MRLSNRIITFITYKFARKARGLVAEEAQASMGALISVPP